MTADKKPSFYCWPFEDQEMDCPCEEQCPECSELEAEGYAIQIEEGGKV